MKTSKPLKQLVPQILTHIEYYKPLVEYNQKLIDIYEGQLLPYIEAQLQKELSPESFEIAKNRIPPINIIQQIIQKSCSSYIEPASRSVIIDNEIDKELMNEFLESNELDNKLQFFEEYLMLGKYCSLELYKDEDNKTKVRIVYNNQYLPFSDSALNPNEMTVYIKFMGKRVKESLVYTDSNGTVLDKPINHIRDVNIFHLFSEDEFLEIDNEGEGFNYIEHNNGYIPFIHRYYGSKLIPTPEADMFKMAVIIPSLMTDINYYIQFCTHSTMYGIDVELPPNVRKAPDAFWSIKSSGEEGANPMIGTINSNADTEKIWDTIKNLLSMFLETKGLKTSSTGSSNLSNNVSGIAKIVDESDATKVKKKSKQQMLQTERILWTKVKLMNDESKGFSEDFKVSIEFSEEKPLIDFNELLEQESKLKTLGLTNKKMSLIRLYPEKTEQEIDIMIELLALESEPLVEEIIEPKEEEIEEPKEDKV